MGSLPWLSGEEAAQIRESYERLSKEAREGLPVDRVQFVFDHPDSSEVAKRAADARFGNGS